MNKFAFTEKYLSQIPALQVLIKLGYEYLSPEQALAMRGGKTSNVLLESVLREQLPRLNRIHYKGNEHHFSEANIQEAIQKLKSVKQDGLQKANGAIYDLITLGTALGQTIDGDSKSFTLNYIDWKNPRNNVFHVVPEFSVERSRSTETARPDIVLFVNGIPLCVIECKSPQVEIKEAVSQNIRNQGADYIPKLFAYTQLVMGVNKNTVKYATAGTAAKFWSTWKEIGNQKEEDIAAIVNTPLSADQESSLFSGEFATAQKYFDELERTVTEQDKAIYNLCRPERLLELAHRFTLFEYGEKKIARYQQFFVVREAMARIKQRDTNGNRTGGIVWHTQGSGKSLTMVMLARALALDTDITNQRIILVTDRDDLDKQLGNTFEGCGLSKARATSGRNLVRHLKDQVGIITTLIHKFAKAWESERFVDGSSDIFVLVDESHRTNFGLLAAEMRRILPNACYLGFTGTPLLKTEKSSFAKFGGLINPHYSIREAVEDKAVLPLLYESRHVEMEQSKSVDLWFERHTSDLNQRQQADLKRKYARAETLNKADQVIYTRAYDISEHYRKNWKNTGFKAQLAAPGKLAALKYHEYLKQIGHVTSEVIISAPDTREGHEEVSEGPIGEVGKFWDKMMERYGTEEEYTKQVIKKFKNIGEPDILIVVDKLLTGFDAPKNTVLYLCRKLREHTLLQAIARVNRLHEGKDYGYIVDYVGMLGELDKALTMYDEFEGYDEEDLADALTSVNEEVQKLSGYHSGLLSLFKAIKNTKDEEAYEVLLADEELRKDFYEHLTKYGKTLAIALSTDKFIRDTNEEAIKEYKGDLKRFENLRRSVALRYAETIDYGDYESKIQKLLDTHIQANEVFQIHKPVDIFNSQDLNAVKEGHGIYSSKSESARADAIAHATKRVIHEKMDEDPAFYEKFSKLIQKAIDDFKAQRLSGMEYLNEVNDLRDKVTSMYHDDVPERIRDNEETCAYYGIAKNYFSQESMEIAESIVVDMSIAFQRAFEKEEVVDFWNNQNAINKVKGHMDDFFYDELKKNHGIDLKSKQMDEIIEKTLQTAKSRRR